jgi:SAM-dependent methyltransferase
MSAEPPDQSPGSATSEPVDALSVSRDPASVRNPPSDEEYTRILANWQLAGWKRIANVQLPYRALLRRMAKGNTLEVGCGLGRNLEHLRGRSVGVDTNRVSVEIARSRGLPAYTADEFATLRHEFEPFDTLLASHLLEHLGVEVAVATLGEYLPALNESARVVLITPQEAGYRPDPTHVAFIGFSELTEVATRLGFTPHWQRSFPLPRVVGRVFRYNEFVLVADRA